MSKEKQQLEQSLIHGQTLLDHLEATYTPADAYFACVLALATLTVMMDLRLETTLDGVKAVYADLKAQEGGGIDGTH